MNRHFLAFDLGAESGRAVLATYDGSSLALEELHRFANEPVAVGSELYWDILRLWHEIRRGLQAASQHGPAELDGIGVDTWGVDYALLGENGRLLQNPYHYRDSRTDKIMDEFFRIVPREEVYRQTGVQFMQLNTLFQIFAASRQTPGLLALTEHFLTVPDLLNYWLTGVMRSEFTIATTTQMYDPRRRGWASDLLSRSGLPTNIYSEVIQPGTVVGSLLPSLASAAGLSGADVIAPACHDTGSAVAAISMTPSTVFLSSGTWSLMGAEIPEPIINDEALRLNFTNEGGVGGTIRLLKNIMGMWLLQGCRRRWLAEGKECDYGTLVNLASARPVLRTIVDPDHASFLHPTDMTATLREYARRTEQPQPEVQADYVQTVLESLALKYRYTVDALRALTGTRYTEIRVVGGGAKNRMLNQYTADATGLRVIAGPFEATALGNVAMQMVARGAAGSVAEARAIIDRSFATETYEPRDQAPWDAAYQRLQHQMTGAAAGVH
jgi:rhamnulokinase